MIIIPCCDAKSRENGEQRKIKLVFDVELSVYRKALMESISQRPELWTFQMNRKSRALNRNRGLFERDSSAVLPAFERYTGSLYSELSKDGKQQALSGDSSFFILSALYGLILPGDEIAFYDLMMTDTCRDPECLSKFPPGRAGGVGGLWKRALKTSSICLGEPAFVLGFLSGKYDEVARALVCSKTAAKNYLQVEVKNGNSADTSRLRGQFLDEGLRTVDRSTLQAWESLAKRTKFPRIVLRRESCA